MFDLALCYNDAMKIEWNSVTWYSKMLALALFVALPFIGFWYGMQYGASVGYLAVQRDNAASVAAPTVSAADNGSEYYGNPAEWQSYSDTKGGFAISYPIDFPTDENYPSSPSTDWTILNDGTASGVLSFTLTIPASFEPQTNFADAKLTVGWSGDSGAVTQCMAPAIGGGPSGSATSSVILGGMPFTVFHSNDAGAGNYYETTSYRTLRAGRCYAVEYTVHSSQIANYPASMISILSMKAW